MKPRRSNLCNICAGIELDLSKFVEEKTIETNPTSDPRNNNEPWINVGRAGDIRKREEESKCPLCRLLIDIISHRARALNDNALSFYIRRRYSYHCHPNPERGLRLGQHLITYFSRLLLSTTRKSHPTAQDIDAVLGHVSQGKERTLSSLYSGRIVESSSLDFGLINRWLRMCETTHANCTQEREERFEKQGRELPEDLAVIDVTTRRLVKLPKKADYVALSYVWGATAMFCLDTENEQELRTNGLERVWNEVPRTVQDAISLVEKLGRRYLWVDSLCIVQDRQERKKDLRKKDLIRQMDTIYGRASFTIIAANGDDANTGLPGVKAGTRNAVQLRGRINQDLTLVALQHSEDRQGEFARTTYSQRAWTFQEELLSIRSIVFLNDTVHFQCKCAKYFEDLESYVETNVTNTDLMDEYCTTHGKSGDDNRPNFSGFKSMVYRYTGRQLTFASDMLNAFDGISAFISQGCNTRFRCGLPTEFFDLSLLWRPEERLKRRQGFSSWTWAGWEGRIGYWPGYYWYTNENEWNQQATYIDWRHPTEGMSGGSIQDVVVSVSASKEKLRILLCPQISVDPAWFSGPRTLPMTILPPRAELLSFWALSARFHLKETVQGETYGLKKGHGPYRNHTYADAGVVRLDIVNRQDKACGNVLVDTDWWQLRKEGGRLVGKGYRFIILSESEQRDGSDHNFLNVLLVEQMYAQEVGAVWERVGAGLVLKLHLGEACAPGPRWEFFNLE